MCCTVGIEGALLAEALPTGAGEGFIVFMLIQNMVSQSCFSREHFPTQMAPMLFDFGF